MANDFVFNGKNGSNRFKGMNSQDILEYLGNPKELSEEDLKSAIKTLIDNGDAHFMIGSKEQSMSLQDVADKFGADFAAEFLAKILKKHDVNSRIVQGTADDLENAVEAVKNGNATEDQKVLAKMVLNEMVKDRLSCNGDCENCEDCENEEEDRSEKISSFMNKTGNMDEKGHVGLSLDIIAHVLFVMHDKFVANEVEDVYVRDIMMPIMEILGSSFSIDKESGISGKNISDVMSSVENIVTYFIKGAKLYKGTKKDITSHMIVLALIVTAICIATDDNSEMKLMSPKDIGDELGVFKSEAFDIITEAKKKYDAELTDIVNRGTEEVHKKANKKSSKKKDIRDMLMDD